MSDYHQGFQDCYSEIVKSGDYIPKSVIEDIKAEIEFCHGKCYKNEDNTYSFYMNGTLDRVLEIIDRHIGGDNE